MSYFDHIESAISSNIGIKPTQLFTNAILEVKHSPYQKEVWSSNHWFSGATCFREGIFTIKPWLSSISTTPGFLKEGFPTDMRQVFFPLD